MRMLTWLIACALVLAGSSMAGSPDGSLPGVGTFAYSGPALTSSVSPAMVIAANDAAMAVRSMK